MKKFSWFKAGFGLALGIYAAERVSFVLDGMLMGLLNAKVKDGDQTSDESEE